MFPFESIIKINKESKAPVYKQIAYSVIRAIRNGTLKAEAPLPGSRELAKLLKVHRKTVIAAYDELNTQDWITIVPRKHVCVSGRIPRLRPDRFDERTTERPYANPFLLPFKKLPKTLSVQRTSVPAEIVIDDGHPDIRLSPINELLKTYRSYTTRKASIRYAHVGTEQGSVLLRKELVHYLAATRGLNFNADNILVTHGAQMSIYLAAQLLLDKESRIVVGQPNYPVANKTFEQVGATLIEVSMDQNGINTDEIEKICKKEKITAVYVIPHHHYPTTVTMSVERRMKLLELSGEYSFVIIEDDYDYDYHYNSSPYLPLATSNHGGNVIYVGSFSKILDPSLRIGFMIASEDFISECVALRKLIDVGGDGYMQNALASLIKNGELRRHLKKARKIYHQRRDFLGKMLDEKLSDFISYTLPSGGMAIWIKLLPQYPIESLPEFPQLSIVQVDKKCNAFRFGFASMDESEIEAAVNMLQHKLNSL